ncbi:MAG: hypothetical protein EOM21_03745 [Gammaproteobacteria bacterium]|nr:hypothetical protein [Gammaproteobacteria bacterium]
MSDALDILIEQGRRQPAEDLRVVCLTGDGGADGLGLSATSAAIERGRDVLAIVDDNEGYGNTGQQSSTATPSGTRRRRLNMTHPAHLTPGAAAHDAAATAQSHRPTRAWHRDTPEPRRSPLT